MFKLLAFFAILAAAFAAPQPAPQSAPTRDARGLALTTYSAGLPLAYNAAYQAPIAYSPLSYNGYAYPSYASSYYYNAAPYQYII